MGSRTSFSVSQKLRPELSAKLMLSILSDSPLTRKTEKNVYYSILQIKLTKTSFCQIAECQIVFLGITVNFIVQKLKFFKIEKDDTPIILLSS